MRITDFVYGVPVITTMSGALVAGLVWTGVKQAFGFYVTTFIPQQAIYGVAGIIPLFILWIYLSWLIVLFGLQITYTTQHLEQIQAKEMKQLYAGEDCFIVSEFTVFRMLAFVQESYEKGQAPVRGDQISEAMDLPENFTQKVLEHLLKKKIVLYTGEPQEGYILARDSRNISLDEVATAMGDASFTQKFEYVNETLQDIAKTHVHNLSDYRISDITPTTLPVVQAAEVAEMPEKYGTREPVRYSPAGPTGIGEADRKEQAGNGREGEDKAGEGEHGAESAENTEQNSEEDEKSREAGESGDARG